MSQHFEELEPGRVIASKYRLIRCLGEGGMATVWVAHNEPLDIDVAIKFIRIDLSHPQLADRLLMEARAAAKLGHPAIVRVTDFGKTRRGNPYIVMELLQGEDLGDMLHRNGRLVAVTAVRTLLPIAHALSVAHEKGIVHRDLKPENIFLSKAEDGQIQPKLVDFGIAKLDARGFERLTQAGTTLGSPGYMSPEQARGFDVDQRTDVWAFCVVLYEAISGQLPFHAESYNAVLRRIIEDDVLPITSLAAGDSELWEIINRGFAKEREDRWASMRALGNQLARWLVDRSVSEDIAGASLSATWLQERLSWADNSAILDALQFSERDPVSRPRGTGFTPSSGMRPTVLTSRSSPSLPPPPSFRPPGSMASTMPPPNSSTPSGASLNVESVQDLNPSLTGAAVAVLPTTTRTRWRFAAGMAAALLAGVLLTLFAIKLSTGSGATAYDRASAHEGDVRPAAAPQAVEPDPEVPPPLVAAAPAGSLTVAPSPAVSGSSRATAARTGAVGAKPAGAALAPAALAPGPGRPAPGPAKAAPGAASGPAKKTPDELEIKTNL